MVSHFNFFLKHQRNVTILLSTHTLQEGHVRLANNNNNNIILWENSLKSYWPYYKYNF